MGSPSEIRLEEVIILAPKLWSGTLSSRRFLCPLLLPPSASLSCFQGKRPSETVGCSLPLHSGLVSGD